MYLGISPSQARGTSGHLPPNGLGEFEVALFAQPSTAIVDYLLVASVGFTTSATIAFIKSETFAYPACANPDGCNKKVRRVGEGL
jgi:hypothetical protein